MITPAKKATLLLAGLPEQCPHCRYTTATWLLRVFGYELFAHCPACDLPVTTVEAVAKG